MACERMTLRRRERLIEASLRNMRYYRRFILFYLKASRTRVTTSGRMNAKDDARDLLAQWRYELDELRRLPLLSDCQ